MKELLEIQQSLNAPKNQWNKFGKYYYRNCEDIFTGLKPLLKQQKCTIKIDDELVMIGDRYYIKSTATLRNEKGDEEISNGYAREEESKKGMDGSQVTGASSSYARKYALNGLFAIDDAKDSDTGEHKEELIAEELPTIGQANIEALTKLIEAGKTVTMSDVTNKYKLTPESKIKLESMGIK